MSNVYTKDINVPKTARNKRIYSGNYTITNNAASTVVQENGGATIDWTVVQLTTRQVLHGFEDIAGSTLSLNEATRTLSITGTDFIVWNKGTRFLRDTEEIAIDDTDGLWYIYYDDTNLLTASQTEWDIEIDQPIAIINWNATANTGVIYDNRRSCYDTNHVRLLKQNQKAHEAGDIWVDTTNFDNNLSATDDTVQKALETLDDLISGGGQVQSDWDQSNTEAVDFIKNKPTIPDAQIQSDWLQVTDTALDYIKNKPEIPGGPAQYYPDGLISGGSVTWISGYTYLVSAAVYRIGGIVYYSDSMQVTLDSSDTTYDRRDLITLTTGSIASHITGTPAEDPVKPQVDPAIELELTDVFLLANSTDPTTGTTITDEIIYNENTEWSHSVSGVSVNFDSTTSPLIGSKCADVGLISNNDTITFTHGSALNFVDYETLLLNIKLKETLPGSCSLWVEFLLSGTPCSNPIQMYYNRAYANVWQGLILHIQTWIQYTTTFDGIRIKWRKTGPDNNSLGLYLDYIKLQAGIPQPLTESTIKLIGDVTASGEIGTDINTTLKTVNSNVGTYGSATEYVQLTVDAKGRITAISEGNISFPAQVQSDWEQATNTEPDYIKNKPTIPTVPLLTVQALSGTSVSWDASSGINATLTLSGNTTITLSNLVAGTSGNIKVTNHESNSYTLTFSGYTNKICPAVYSAANVVKTSGGSSKIDVYSWWYDGTHLIWNGTLNYT